MNWVLRPAAGADSADLSELAERTFRDAFSALNTAENMDFHCASAFSPAIQAAEIANPEIHTVVAESQSTLVGFAQLHLRPQPPACVSISPSVELHRIYVDRSFHGTGLAGDLMVHVLQTAAEQGAKAVWLGVWEHNPRAVRFYQRLGFSEVGDHIFVFGSDRQRDLVMVRNLTA